jgi:hypothetical protein
MKTSRFSDSQIMAILKQGEAGVPVPQLCREHGMNRATFYKSRENMVVCHSHAVSLYHGSDEKIQSNISTLT